MSNLSTFGVICLKDEYGLEYFICDLEYKLFDDDSFEYIFTPHYSVIDLLDSSLFQGIPGLDLSKRKNQYIRRNRIPTFISERSPNHNREDLWDYLKQVDMDYPNQLEWLIRTDTHYIGDKLYVIRKNEVVSKHIIFDDSHKKRSLDIMKELLRYICKGYTIEYNLMIINDQNRKDCFSLLYNLFNREALAISKLQRIGIDNAKKENKYKGRKPIEIDDVLFHKVYSQYKNKEITSFQASDILHVSVATFYRYIKKHNSLY